MKHEILLCTKTKISKKEEKGGPFWHRLYSAELGVGERRVKEAKRSCKVGKRKAVRSPFFPLPPSFWAKKIKHFNF